MTALAPFVLLHGFSSGPAAWAPIAPLLAPHARVLTPTLVGHRGGALLPRGERPSIGRYADALERELDDAGIGLANVIGNSLGGWLTLELAARGRAASALCLAPAGGWRPGSLFERALMLRFGGAWLVGRTVRPAALRRPRFRRALLSAMVAHPERMSPEAVAAVLEDLAGCTVLAPTLVDPRTREFSALGPISCPVRIAWSSDDHLLLKRWARQRFAEIVPSAEQVELPESGHVPMSDQPLAIVEHALAIARPA